MKFDKIIFLTLGIFILLLSGLNLYAEVIVFDEKGIKDSLSEGETKTDSSASAAGPEDKGTEAGIELRAEKNAQKPELGAGGMNITLEGVRMGDTVVSSPVTLSQTGVILDIKTEPIDLGFSIMRVDKSGETLALGGDSLDAGIRKKLSAGTYKVYPVANLSTGAASTEKAKVSIIIGPE